MAIVVSQVTSSQVSEAYSDGEGFVSSDDLQIRIGADLHHGCHRSGVDRAGADPSLGFTVAMAAHHWWRVEQGALHGFCEPSTRGVSHHLPGSCHASRHWFWCRWVFVAKGFVVASSKRLLGFRAFHSFSDAVAAILSFLALVKLVPLCGLDGEVQVGPRGFGANLPLGRGFCGTIGLV